MAGDYTPIQHLLDKVDDYHVIIGLKDRIKCQLQRAYAIGFFHGDDPRGDSPDREAPGKPGVPGEGSRDLSSDASADYAGVLDWPKLADPTARYESVWEGGIEFYPDGTAYIWQRDLVAGKSEP